MSMERELFRTQDKEEKACSYQARGWCVIISHRCLYPSPSYCPILLQLAQRKPLGMSEPGSLPGEKGEGSEASKEGEGKEDG